jgi:hypothetical protein
MLMHQTHRKWAHKSKKSSAAGLVLDLVYNSQVEQFFT